MHLGQLVPPWYCSSNCSRKEPLGKTETGFLWAECLFHHPTNGIKALEIKSNDPIQKKTLTGLIISLLIIIFSGKGNCSLHTGFLIPVTSDKQYKKV